MVKGKNQIERLAELYRTELDKLLLNYKAVGALDADILQELGVDVSMLKSGLKSKISGLKSLYWKELFDKLEKLTDRLTSKTRSAMLDTLNGQTSVDFTESNIYAVVIWALKHVNSYIDSQLTELYLTMTSKANTTGYKSNRHMLEDTWRNCRGSWDERQVRDKASHYTLEYRIVLEHHEAIGVPDRYGFGPSEYQYPNNLAKTAHDYLSDIFTIAHNLGYPIDNDTYCREWESNKAQKFYYSDQGQLFCEVRAFKNGNIHIKFDQEFMQAFNIEAARLNGWIKSPREASEEMGVDFNIASKMFNTNLQLGYNQLQLTA
jgi:hypothetical protein